MLCRMLNPSHQVENDTQNCLVGSWAPLCGTGYLKLGMCSDFEKEEKKGTIPEYQLIHVLLFMRDAILKN